MARAFKPSTPYTVAMKLLIPTETKVKGTTKKTFPDPETINKIFFGSVKTYGGTENMNNNVYTVYDTATVETWYRPDITSDCRIYICGTGETWDVISRPEDIDMRHQFMQFKAQKVGGKP
jgi:head-tail adaptor